MVVYRYRLTAVPFPDELALSAAILVLQLEYGAASTSSVDVPRDYLSAIDRWRIQCAAAYSG